MFQLCFNMQNWNEEIPNFTHVSLMCSFTGSFVRYIQINQFSHSQHNSTGFERSKLIYHGLSVT